VQKANVYVQQASRNVQVAVVGSQKIFRLNATTRLPRKKDHKVAAMYSSTDHDNHDKQHDEDNAMQEGGGRDEQQKTVPRRRDRNRWGGGGGLPNVNEFQTNIPGESRPGGTLFRYVVDEAEIGD
jgi:hypothetical protein